MALLSKCLVIPIHLSPNSVTERICTESGFLATRTRNTIRPRPQDTFITDYIAMWYQILLQ